MKWIIHIGVEKTGSKALQTFFSKSLNKTARPNIIYPVEGRSGLWHEPLYYQLLSGDNSGLLRIVAEAKEADADFKLINYDNKGFSATAFM